ncbi:hypothetical protein JCM19233_4910 [Vibrio astriarenae]|nr:hypothetical protein JCM19233_4910 [Vibrio sp. C7]
MSYTAKAPSSPPPCVPITPSPWSTPNGTIKIDSQLILTSGCTLQCVWGGTITCISPSQTKVTGGNVVQRGSSTQDRAHSTEHIRREYSPDATSQLNYVGKSWYYWKSANLGQWFMGVIDTSQKLVSLVPVNVFDRSMGVLNEQTLMNISQQGMNRYASGAYGEAKGDSIMPDFLKNRPVGMTHHLAVALNASFFKESSLGFTLIKINDDYAQMKTTSTSLNGDKPDFVVNHSFSRATALNVAHFVPTGAQMPIQWRDSLTEYLKRDFGIKNIIVSND